MKDTKKINKKTYNAIASEYETNYGNIPASIEYTEYIIKQIKEIPKPKILDLGCGTGTLLKMFEDNNSNADLIGVDFSEELLKIAKQKLKRTKLICEDFSKFQSNEQFDVIIATFSFIHSSDNELKEMMKKVYSMLKADGYLYVAFILGEGEQLVDEALDLTQKTYFNYHNEEFLTNLFKENGFSIVKKKIFHVQDDFENEDDIYFVLQKNLFLT